MESQSCLDKVLPITQNYFDSEFKKMSLLKLEEDLVETWLVEEKIKKCEKVARIYKINLFSEKYLTSFLKRIKKAKTLNHNNLLTVEKSLISKNQIILLFKKQQVSLCDILKNLFPKGIQDWDILKTIMIPIVKGLEYLHSQHIIHNNLTIKSIYIDFDNNIKLDYFQHFLSKKEGSKKKNAFGNICYLAPELIKANLNGYDQTIDLYAFAVLLYKLVTGKTYLEKFSVIEAITKIEKENHPDFSKFKKIFPQKILKLLNSCLDKNTKNRPCFTDFSKLLKDNTFVTNNFVINEKLIQRYCNTTSYYRRRTINFTKTTFIY